MRPLAVSETQKKIVPKNCNRIAEPYGRLGNFPMWSLRGGGKAQNNARPPYPKHTGGGGEGSVERRDWQNQNKTSRIDEKSGEMFVF